MATLTKCPSCGQPLPVPRESSGSRITCPNPACAKTIPVVAALDPVLTDSGVKAPVVVVRVPTRPPGARPELLDKIPTSFFASPPMAVIGGVVALLYGIVLFSVVSAQRNRPEPPPPPGPTYALITHPVEPAPTAPTKETPKPAPTTSPAKAPSAAKPGAQADGKKPEGKKQDVAKKPAPKPKKNEIARASTPPVPPPPPPPVSKRESWGVLSGMTGDCEFRLEDQNLIIAIPGTLHVISPELMMRNSPRLLTDVRGDFVASVKVAGQIRPGTRPIMKLPFTFQGAGLLVWQDENNYLRLERASIFDVVGSKRLHQVLLEHCREGKTASVLKDASDTDLALRLERRGSEIRCMYSPDGKTWLEIKRQLVHFPADIQVGVSASNASPKPFAARLEEFDLSGPPAKPGSNP